MQEKQEEIDEHRKVVLSKPTPPKSAAMKVIDEEKDDMPMMNTKKMVSEPLEGEDEEITIVGKKRKAKKSKKQKHNENKIKQ